MALLIAILGYLLNGIAVTIDKFLLSKSIPNPLTYVFYVSAVSLSGLLLLPLSRIPSFPLFIIISISTTAWTVGAIFLFKALQIGTVTRVIPAIGTLTPLFLFFYSSYTRNITFNQTWAVFFLIAGLVAITLPDWKGKLKPLEIVFEILASILFTLYYILLKEAFLQSDFISVTAWSRVILLPALVVILITPALKKKFLTSKGEKVKSSLRGIFFFSGQIAGGVAGILLNLAVSLSSPALISSLQAVQYAFLFIFSILLLKKFPGIFKFEVSFFNISTKIIGIILIFLGLFSLVSLENPSKKMALGVTFSPRFAYQLGLDPKLTYLKALDDLKVKKIRLPVYWDEVETFPMRVNFAQVDYYLDQAFYRDVSVILVVGVKQPRWPECFTPPWIKDLMPGIQEEKILQFVKLEIEHFKKYPNIAAWQIENEPFFDFGSCQFVANLQKTDLIKKEVELVRNIDNTRPIIITDSGELGLWTDGVENSDIFGTTLYRQVWNPIFGRLNYPLPPFFYTLKNNLVRAILNKKGETIISELQAEPWITDSKIPADVDLAAQKKIFPLSKLKENIAYAGETGFGEAYLWGVEWWYYMAKNGHSQYLDYAKSLFSSNQLQSTY